MKELKGGIGAFAVVSLGSVAFLIGVRPIGKIIPVRRTGFCCPAVLNHSPIRDPDAVSFSASVT